MRIFATPNLQLAGIVDTPKVASSSIARAVIARCHPEIDRQLTGRSDYPAGYDRDNIHWQQLCPKLHANDREPVAMLIRDPVSRFVAACHQFAVTPAALLNGEAQLPDGRQITFDDPHFRSQSWLRDHHAEKHVVHVWRLEDQLPDFLAATGLRSLPKLNAAAQKSHAKPTLTPQDRRRVETVYAADLDLHATVSTSRPARNSPISLRSHS